MSKTPANYSHVEASLKLTFGMQTLNRTSHCGNDVLHEHAAVSILRNDVTNDFLDIIQRPSFI
jgi:hypothetical protein